MKKPIEGKIKKIFLLIFKKKDIKPNFNRSSEKKWDSLNHVNIIIAIENEFKIKFNSVEIENMNSFKKIENIVIRKIKNK